MLRNSLLIALGTTLPLGLGSYWAFGGDKCCGEKAAAPTPACCASEASVETAEPFVSAAFLPQGGSKAVDAASAGSIKGVIKFDGAAPKRDAIDMKQDATCSGLHKEPVLKEEVVVNDGMLKNVFIYISKGLEDYKFEVPKEAVLLNQKGCVYEPHVFGIMVGQMIQIKNSDEVTHNVHMSPRKNAPINKGQPAKAADIEEKFKAAETAVPVKCDIHPWMTAMAHVVKTPCFAVSDDKGGFEIKGVPAGKYTIEAIHESLGKQTLEVEVKEKAAAEAAFTFKAK